MVHHLEQLLDVYLLRSRKFIDINDQILASSLSLPFLFLVQQNLLQFVSLSETLSHESMPFRSLAFSGEDLQVRPIPRHCIPQQTFAEGSLIR